jgi:hypothetical protein
LVVIPSFFHAIFPISRKTILCFLGVSLLAVNSSRSEILDSKPDSTASTAISALPLGMRVYRVTPDLSYGFSRPKSFSFVTNYPLNHKIYFSTAFRRNNWAKIGFVAASTALLLVYDQPLVDEAKRLGRRWGIPSDNHQKSIGHVGKFPVYVPASTGSMLYYIGDGTTHFLIAGSFMTYGFIARDNRALVTASQLAEGMLTVGTLVQVLKHMTGHETPARATVPGGRWRWFPNQMDYLNHVSKYDAYPSGHLATAMMCVTVISRNYPEHHYIRPLGYALMTVLGYQMMNNGVHWASDYPLAIALGYSFGKIIQSRGHVAIDGRTGQIIPPEKGLFDSMNLTPSVMPGNGIGISFCLGW